MRILVGMTAMVAAMVTCAAWGEDVSLAREVTPRQGLGRFLKKLRKGGEVRVAYLGGSITQQGDDKTHRGGWRVKTTQWLRETYPQAKIVEINAAIGGTGSGLGVYRVGEDVLAKKPDLLFVEFACNDGGDRAHTNGVMRTMEGIVRQTWKADPATDIAFVYTITHAMTNTYAKGSRPAAARADEAVAAHYGIPSADFGPRVTKELLSDRLYFGKVRKGDPRVAFAHDGVHPSDEGHDYYLASIKALFASVGNLPPADHAAALARPPLVANSYENAKLVPITPAIMSGDWARVAATGQFARIARDFAGDAWMAQKPGSRLTFRFKGTHCKVYDILGPDCGRIRVTVDGKLLAIRDRFDSYCTNYRRADLYVAQDLPDKVHTVELAIDPKQPDRHSVAFRLKDPEKELAAPKYNGTRWIAGRLMLVGDLVK